MEEDHFTFALVLRIGSSSFEYTSQTGSQPFSDPSRTRSVSAFLSMRTLVGKPSLAWDSTERLLTRLAVVQLLDTRKSSGANPTSPQRTNPWNGQKRQHICPSLDCF